MTGQTAVAKASDAQRTRCERCPLRKLEVFRQFAPKELEFISSFKVGEFRAEAGTALLLAGNNSAHLYTMLSGWAFRSKELSDGRRQILNFAFPGDFIGLQSAVLDAMEHSVVALTDVVLCVFEREKLWRLFESHPGLGFDMTWLAAREERMLDEHLLSIGRRTALERTAYFLLHVYRRAKELSLAKDNALVLPMTQQHLADALGMSIVHTNKTLRKLYNRKLVTWRDRTLTILDPEGLAVAAGHEMDPYSVRPLI